ncbi:sensor histidine kinase [Sphaerotilus sp.]|uniref:sensor histidine kinase n=1 Tax=Sphaerotilus sp. TaxID=2093942 RepID=UPI0034E2DE5A
MAHSLRARLLVWVLVPLAAAVAIDARIGYVGADETTTLMQDRLLLGSARMIAEDLRFEDGVVQPTIPPAAIELFQSGGIDRVYYRVTSPKGELLIGYADLPAPQRPAASEAPRYVTMAMRGEPVRMVVLVQPVVTPSGTMLLSVEVAQTLRGHRQMLHSLWLRTVEPLLLIWLLATLLILFGLRRGLLPVTQLRDLMQSRDPGTLEPLSTAGVPLELVPLVEALNDYIRRLDQHASSQRIFIENAAHQLRTPLAVLNAQVATASRSRDDRVRDESLAAIRQTAHHAARLVNQLLTLSVADSAANQAAAAAPIDLDEVVRVALENAAVAAQAKDIDLGFERHGPIRPLYADPVMVREVVSNLLDNAIRYTQHGGIVTVRVQAHAQEIELVVEDNGPGIDPALTERVFERFFRVNNGDVSGAGLGLAIVRQFAQRMGACVTLGPTVHGVGLMVSMRWDTSGFAPCALRAGSCPRESTPARS